MSEKHSRAAQRQKTENELHHKSKIVSIMWNMKQFITIFYDLWNAFRVQRDNLSIDMLWDFFESEQLVLVSWVEVESFPLTMRNLHITSCWNQDFIPHGLFATRSFSFVSQLNADCHNKRDEEIVDILSFYIQFSFGRKQFHIAVTYGFFSVSRSLHDECAEKSAKRLLIKHGRLIVDDRMLRIIVVDI